MPLSTLKDKGQITLPSSIRKRIHADKGDIFHFEIVDGKVIMTLQKLIPANASKKVSDVNKHIDMSKYIGAGKGIYGSVEEIDGYIRKERDSWED